jgi:hypothetical protein
MNKRLLLSLLAASLSAIWLHAAEEEDEYSPELGIFASAKNSVKFGFRMVSGAKVHFGNLGIVPQVDIPLTGDVTRTYSNGIVVKDVLRDANSGRSEVDANGVQTSTPGGRYNTFITAADGSQTLVGDFVSFTPGQTRNWRHDSATQVTADGSGIVMSAFSASSDGASFEGKKQTSNGVELQMERIVGKLGGKWEVSIIGGIALSGISNKQAGDVHSTLHTLSDTFSLLGRTAPDVNPQGQPTFDGLPLTDGTEVPNGHETTVPLASTPNAGDRKETNAVGAANVSGVWKIKGAYYVMKVGPEIRTTFAKDFGFSASVGLAGAYVGTNYTANESLTVDGVAPITTSETSSINKFMPGYYANIDALWQANERTGFFAGITYEQFNSYDQSVGGRTAKIDLGATAGIRGGISIKF